VAAGQVLGGVVVTADLAGSTWRAVFLVNAPIGVALLAAAWRHLPAGRAGARAFDVPGMLALAAPMVLLVLPLAVGRELGWPVWSVACLVAVAPALAAFLAVERACLRRGGEPLVDLTLLGDRVVALGVAAIMAVMAGFAAFAFMLTLHLQGGLGYSPLRASLTFLPYAVGFGAASLNWRRLSSGWHAWTAPAGFALLAACEVGLAVAFGAGPDRWPVPVGALMFGAGAAHAAAFAPLAVAVTARARPEQAASLSGMLSTATTLAAVVGVAAGGGAYLAVASAAGGGSTAAFQVGAVGLAAAMLASGVAALGAGGTQAGSRIAHVARRRRRLRSGPS
jgi:predicted MFS family arabinose efflux permease